MKYLFVSTSNLAAAFVKVHFAEQEMPDIVGTIKSNEGCVIAQFYSISEQIILCQVDSNSMSVDEVNQIGTKIIEVCPKNCAIAILASESIVNYHQEKSSEEDSFILRKVQNSHWKSTPKVGCPLLEQPNVIGGISAAILTISELQGLPCILIVQYSSSNLIDSQNMEGYNIIKENVKSFCKPVLNQEIQKRYKNLASRAPSNFLYTWTVITKSTK